MEVETEVIVEEGEITDESSDDLDTYKVLERPQELINSHKPTVQHISESESSISSDSDSDKGFARTAKRKKLKPTKPKNQCKYNVWSSRAQEDLLTETLNSCDVTKVDRSLGVESYDFTQSNRYKDEQLKRKYSDRKNVHLRLGKRKKKEEDQKSAPRVILDLTTDADSSLDELSKDIANKLMEEKDDLIYKIVSILGKEKSIELFKDTQKAEADGGVLIMNGTRRRTPGGVYIFFLKKFATHEQQIQIFSEERKQFKQERKRKQKEILKKKLNKLGESTNEQELPSLPSRAELLNLKIKEPLKNPPCSPASEDSNVPQNNSDRSLNNYSDDFLDLALENDMDTF